MLRTCVRILLALFAAILVLGFSRPAAAAGPFCDPQGVTALAPTPAHAVADVRFEAGSDMAFWILCRQLRGAVLVSRPLSDSSHASEKGPWPSFELALPPVTQAFAWVSEGSRLPIEVTNKKGPPGFGRSVYRPPR